LEGHNSQETVIFGGPQQSTNSNLLEPLPRSCRIVPVTCTRTRSPVSFAATPLHTTWDTVATLEASSHAPYMHMVGCVLEIMGEERRSFSLEKARPLLRVKEQRGDAPPVFSPHAMRLLKLKARG
jgi:hypothetical protein